MLKITIPGEELWDEEREVFVYTADVVLEMEHSLVSLSKWEEKFEKPFLSLSNPTTEETLGYIRAMILTPDIPDDIVYKLTQENLNEINSYINAKMSATWFANDNDKSRSSEIITAELIYFWMTAFSIPIEHERRHLNQLFTIIKIANTKQNPPKKMSRQEIHEQNRRLNAQRKAQLGTSG